MKELGLLRLRKTSRAHSAFVIMELIGQIWLIIELWQMFTSIFYNSHYEN